MFNRTCVNALLLAGLALSMVGCTSNSGLDSIQVSPATQSLAIGQTTQFTAAGSYGNSNHLSTQNVTSLVTWTSSTPAVATVNSSGVATALAAGSTTITASTAAFNGPVTASATITVTAPSGGGTGSGGGTAGNSIVSLSIIPGSQSVASPTQTSQFIAIGTTTSGATENLTGQVAWSSSSAQVVTINSTGLATGVGQGTATITAIATNSNNTVATATSSFTVVAGTQEPITALSIDPGSQAVSASGQTGQFIALGTSGSTGLQADVTNAPQLKWSSSIPTIATVTSGLTKGNGLASGVSAGTTTITAEWTNPDGSVVSATASVAVSLTIAPEPLLSLTIIPSSITVLDLLGTGQFLAMGTYATPPYVRDLTNSPNLTWISDAPSVFTVDSNTGGNAGATAGIVTAYGSGGATIIAEATNPLDGTIQTATATFNCPFALANPNGDPPTPATCAPGTQAPSLLSTLTVYNEGLNTTNWLITAPSATGTPSVIHCGPGSTTGGSVCSANYPVGTTVTLTAPATGAAFGGWSYNCANTAPVTAAGPNSCTVTLTVDDTVGAIFN